MRVINTGSKYHLSNTPEKFIPEAARSKKKIYLKACLHQCWNLLPFVAPIDGLLGVEAGDTMKRISSRLTTRWHQPHSRMCRYVKSRIAITLVRATHRCIRGFRLLANRISVQHLKWEYGSRLKLF